MNKFKRHRGRGTTLVEMLVAVTITIGMLGMVGMVFKSSSKASGKALAYNELLRQARALTRQLEDDFRGLRADMPMAIIWEEELADVDGDYNVDPCEVIRKDRIVFFANGDFQTIDGQYSGNLARIFYGQSLDTYNTPVHEEDPCAPPRRILARRTKILTPLGLPVVDSTNWSAWGSPEIFDDNPLEKSVVGYWKNEIPQNYIDYHFRTWDPALTASPPNQWKVSMVRRPNIEEVVNAMYAGTVSSDGIQKIYMLPDVGEFKIEAWYNYQQQWGDVPCPMAMYWNIPDLDGGSLLSNGMPAGQNIDVHYWWSSTDIGTYVAVGMGLTQPVDTWPGGLRFTFRLYDKDRRHFPEGKEFSYIVRLPARQ